jgi:hypothetical protein
LGTGVSMGCCLLDSSMVPYVSTPSFARYWTKGRYAGDSNIGSDGSGVGDYPGESVNDGDRPIETFPSAALLRAKQKMLPPVNCTDIFTFLVPLPEKSIRRLPHRYIPMPNISLNNGLYWKSSRLRFSRIHPIPFPCLLCASCMVCPIGRCNHDEEHRL